MSGPRRRREGGHVSSVRIRDGAKCHLCGQGVSAIEASRDHKKPRSAGGYDKSGNYLLAHRDCNTARGAMPLDVTYRVIEEMRISGIRVTRRTVVIALRAAHGRWIRSQRQ